MHLKTCFNIEKKCISSAQIDIYAAPPRLQFDYQIHIRHVMCIWRNVRQLTPKRRFQVLSGLYYSTLESNLTITHVQCFNSHITLVQRVLLVRLAANGVY